MADKEHMELLWSGVVAWKRIEMGGGSLFSITGDNWASL